MIPHYLEQKQTLEEFLSNRDRYDINPRDVPVHLAASPEWEQQRDISQIVGGMLRHHLSSALTAPHFVKNDRYREINPALIDYIEDLVEIPLMVKDSILGTGSKKNPGLKGYRDQVHEDKMQLVPTNLDALITQQEAANPDHKEILKRYGGQKLLIFGSGGTQGKSTQTVLSYLTVELETYALVRALAANGFEPEQKILCMYAPEHKGGFQLERAAEIMDMEFHSKAQLFQWVERLSPEYRAKVHAFRRAIAREDYEEADEHALLIRKGIRRYIAEHEIEVIEAVQPTQGIDTGAKGMGLAAMKIYEENPSAFSKVKHAFLTGFTVPKQAYKTLQEAGIQVSTTWGSTEGMALATSGITDGNVNDLTALNFPTIGQVFWYRERFLGESKLERVPIGKTGLLAITSLGASYINNLMDIATRTESGFLDIHRPPSDNGVSINSCAGDALTHV